MARAEKRRKTTATDIIPDDLLIYEVLVHLPAKSLALCRCVCRSWRTGIAGAAFTRRHLELSHKRPPSVLLIPRQIDYDDDQATSGYISFYRLSLPPGPVHGDTQPDCLFERACHAGEGITWLISPSHCDGLVAIATRTDRVVVCNPVTREFLVLPDASHNAQLDHCEMVVPPVALGFDRWRNRYIVARCFYRTYGNISFDVGHEVFTLGGDDSCRSWEPTQDPPHAVGGTERPICTRQAIYWHSDVPKPQLMRFGLQHRKFDVVPCPPPGWDSNIEVTELDGKLCYVRATAEASFQVWLADETPELQWSLRYRVDLLNPEPRVHYVLNPIAIDGDDALVAIGADTVCRYDVKGQGVEVLDMRSNMRYRSQYMCPGRNYELYAVPYIESLVTLIRACTGDTN
ncbi:hypothetical protein BS78_03G214100 [Paspalum vaginatum]|nr:hypothetical protein BS78_03G214100 [Paspalum vaginatum]